MEVITQIPVPTETSSNLMPQTQDMTCKDSSSSPHQASNPSIGVSPGKLNEATPKPLVEPLSLKELTKDKVDQLKETGDSIQNGFNKVMDDIASLCICDSEESTPSEGNTPRDEDLSSGSPSPIPDENGLIEKEKPKVFLGKDLSMMMQALNSLNSPEEKIAALCKKYADLLESNRMLQKKLKVSQRKQAPMVKEICQLQTDLSKSMTMKSKIENVARELQKQNKNLRAEYDAELSDMHKAKNDISHKFETNLNDISKRMEFIVNTNKTLSKENKKMENKMKSLVDEYTARCNHFENTLVKQAQEEELMKLKLEKSELLLQREKQNNVEDQFQMAKQENTLRQQLLEYSEKFEGLEDTLKKSDSVFKKLMERIDSLQKSELEWQKKAMTQECEKLKMIKKTKRLENLCRALQTERNNLADKLAAFELIKKPVTKVSSRAEKLAKKSKESSKKKLPVEEPESPMTSDSNEQTLEAVVGKIKLPPATDMEINDDVREILSDIVNTACSMDNEGV